MTGTLQPAGTLGTQILMLPEGLAWYWNGPAAL
jgi:hypothetical protein